MKQYRSYKIPDARVGYYGTGLNKVKVAEVRKLEELIEPVEQYLTNLLELKQIHLSLRYLGYHDEINDDNLKDAKQRVFDIYSKYLPITVHISSISGSWKDHSDAERQLLFADVKDKKLIQLHKELVKATTIFPIFQAVEGVNFKPHIALAELEKKYHKKIPRELEVYIKNTKVDIDNTLKGAYIWDKRGLRQLI